MSTLEEHRDDGLGVSIITLGEVYEGAYNNPNPSVHIASFQEFLALFTVLPLTEDTMRHFARLRALLRKQGNLIPDLDLLIADTAPVVHGPMEGAGSTVAVVLVAVAE